MTINLAIMVHMGKEFIIICCLDAEAVTFYNPSTVLKHINFGEGRLILKVKKNKNHLP